MALDPNGLPSVAGYSSSGSVDLERCTQAPCTDATQWFGTSLATDGLGTSDRIGFQLTTRGDGRLAYTNQQGNLRLVSEDGGLWTNSAVTQCGSTLISGAQPALFLTPADDPRLAYTSTTLPFDGGVASGVGYFSNGP
jgi:hypothetical protein